MKNISDKGKTPINVQFEYINDNDILVLSKEYKIYISLLENTEFEANKEKIIKNSNFKTEKERSYYHMFNKSNNKFLIQNSDFLPYIKTNSPIILINCYTYAGQIIDKIKEEFQNVNLLKENSLAIIEIQKKEMELVLSNLENNLQIDMFADEFIFKNGIEYLVTITTFLPINMDRNYYRISFKFRKIKKNDGNIRKYALAAIDKLLSFQNAFDFFEKKAILLSNLYDSFIENKEINCAYLFFDIIVKLIGINEEKTMDLIEKMNENFFNKIINYLSDENKEDNIKSHTLLFINMILNFSKSDKHLNLIIFLTNAGIFEKLDKIIKFKELEFLEQVNLFEFTVQKILNETDKDNDNYNNIKKKYDIFVENKQIYHIQNLIKSTQIEEIKQSAIDELNDLIKNNNMYMFYESFMKNENIELVNSYYDYIIVLLESKKEKEEIIINFVNSARKYAEKTNKKEFSEIINYLSKENKNDLKSHTLLFINKIISFSSLEKQLEIISIFVEDGILDLLIKIGLPMNNEIFLSQIKIFDDSIEKILNNSNKEDNNYKLIKCKFDIYIETKLYNNIKELILKIHNYKEEKQANPFEIELVNLIKGKEGYNILYKIFMENNDNNIAFSFFDIFIKIFGENIMPFIEIAKKYAEKNNSKIFNKIIDYTSEKNTNNFLKGIAMQFSNLIINYTKEDKQYEILSEYEQNGIFENLDKLINNKDTLIITQMKFFLNTVKKILDKSKEKDEKYDIINKKYNKILEAQKFYKKTIDDFVIIEN